MAEDYLEQTDKYLRDAEKEMKKKKKLRQASEKFWGASSQIVKAYAQKKGWEHNGHRELFKVVNKISQETGDEELQDLFGNASALHINFYEGWLTKEQVEINSKAVKKFIDKIKLIYNS